MTAFCRAEMFKEVDLFECLESLFVQRIDEAEGTTLVTMFNAHSAWTLSIIDEVLVKKKHPRRVYTVFKKYNDSFFEHLAVNLIRNVEEINLKGTLLVL